MCWNSNANSICKKILSGIYALKRIKEYVDEKTLVSVSVYNGNAISQPYTLALVVNFIRTHLVKRNPHVSKNFITELLVQIPVCTTRF